jgi:hypothetical protein
MQCFVIFLTRKSKLNFYGGNLTPQQYEVSILIRSIWQLARSNDLNELAAIGCVLRNHVIPRPGQIQTYKSFSEACFDFRKAYPTRPEPTMMEDALVVHPDGLLFVGEQIYDCSYPDLTATATTPGARYFGQASNLPEWLKPLAVSHHLCGTFGAQQFWA